VIIVDLHSRTITTRRIVRTSHTQGQISLVKTENDIEFKRLEILQNQIVPSADELNRRCSIVCTRNLPSIQI
jgi:hypothetical protein